MVLTPWLIVALILVIQPMLYLLYAYLLYRLAVTFTTNKVSNAIDERVDNVLEQVNGGND